jgi:hypothetical protein
MTLIRPPKPLAPYEKLCRWHDVIGMRLAFGVHVNLSLSKGEIHFDQFAAMPLKDSGHYVLHWMSSGVMHPKVWLWYLAQLRRTFDLRVHPHSEDSPVDPQLMQTIRGLAPWPAELTHTRPISNKNWPNEQGFWAPYKLPMDEDEPLFNS